MATGNATSRIVEMGRQAGEQMFHQHERSAFHTPTLLEDVQDWVFQYPVRTLLFGLGIGLITGAVIVRR